MPRDEINLKYDVSHMSHFISPEACASNRWQNPEDQPDACRLGGDRRTGFEPAADEKVGA